MATSSPQAPAITVVVAPSATIAARLNPDLDSPLGTVRATRAAREPQNGHTASLTNT